MNTDSRVIDWSPEFCRCRAILCIDEPQRGKIKCWPCSYDHTIWCIITGQQVLRERLRLINPAPTKYREILDGYLRWQAGEGVFFRPGAVGYILNTVVGGNITAEQAMYDFETYGASLPRTCLNVERLKNYIQGKRIREFMFEMWTEDVDGWKLDERKEKLFAAEEFYTELVEKEGDKASRTFQHLFNRAPDMEFVKYLSNAGVE